jgi:hypothetical protein
MLELSHDFPRGHEREDNMLTEKDIQARDGLVVTEVSKVPIWKAFSINGLRHGVRSNLLIL